MAQDDLWPGSAEHHRRLVEQQNGVRAIQSSHPARAPCVDHCHATRVVRGLLCDKCNTGRSVKMIDAAAGALAAVGLFDRIRVIPAAFYRGPARAAREPARPPIAASAPAGLPLRPGRVIRARRGRVSRSIAPGLRRRGAPPCWRSPERWSPPRCWRSGCDSCGAPRVTCPVSAPRIAIQLRNSTPCAPAQLDPVVDRVARQRFRIVRRSCPGRAGRSPC